MPTEKLSSIVGQELQSLPLQMIISSAMNGIVSAQQLSAQATADFIANTTGDFKFDANVADGANTKKVTVVVPKLAVVPIPSIRVDSATIHFNFEIKEIIAKTTVTDAQAQVDLSAKGLLKTLVNASISGSIAHKSTAENTLNRSGMLDISIHLSEPALPEGLSKVLNFLGNAITLQDPAVTTNA